MQKPADRLKITASILAVALAAFALTRLLADRLAPMERARIAFEHAAFTVEVAATTQQLRQGLQKRPRLEPDNGMLFLFPGGHNAQFWMKDTLISLDILWMDENLRVTYMENSVPPCRQDPCPRYGPGTISHYVLEINAGESDRARIGIGDRATITASPESGP
jgi:uncharacterized membrane protein (UPF0127 family)